MSTFSASSTSSASVSQALSPRRVRTRQLKLERIIDTALELIESGGLEALTLHRLAEELDLAVSGLYRHLPSKSALHAELERFVLAEYHQALRERLDALEGGGPTARLLFIARHYRAHFLAKKGRLALLALSLSDPRQLLDDAENERVLVAVRALLGEVTALFEAARKEGELSMGTAFERTMIFWTVIQGVLQVQKMARSSEFPSGEQLQRATLKTIMLGFGADPRRLSLAARRAEQWPLAPGGRR